MMRGTEDIGATQREIVYFILNHPDGVSEPTIREYLADKLNIKDPSNIKLHLEKLSNRKILTKERFRGRPNRWRLSYENIDEVGRYILYTFIKKDVILNETNQDDIIDVFNSRGMQKFLKETEWKESLWNYIFYFGHPSDDVMEILDKGPILDMIIPLISLSPTLFCELFDPTVECWLLSVSLCSNRYPILKSGHDDENEERFNYSTEDMLHFMIGSRFISPLLFDKFYFTSLAGTVEKYLKDNYVMFYQWFVAYEDFILYEKIYKIKLTDQSFDSEHP